MARKTKRDWLMAALDLLLLEGIDGVTIDALTKRLEVTKGSFYHHFQDITRFKTEMLALCLEEGTLNIIARLDKIESPLERLNRLLEVVTDQGPLEVAVRAWALRDAQAHETLAEVDRSRMEYLSTLLISNGLTHESAMQATQLLYTTLIGAHHLMPPLTPLQIQRLFVIIRDRYNI